MKKLAILSIFLSFHFLTFCIPGKQLGRPYKKYCDKVAEAYLTRKFIVAPNPKNLTDLQKEHSHVAIYGPINDLYRKEIRQAQEKYWEFYRCFKNDPMIPSSQKMQSDQEIREEVRRLCALSVNNAKLKKRLTHFNRDAITGKKSSDDLYIETMNSFRRYFNKMTLPFTFGRKDV